MPVTATHQARVELSKAQARAAMEVMEAALKSNAPMIYFEETNLDGVVAVGTNRGLTLIYHTGESHPLGAGAATQRASQVRKGRPR